MRLSCGLCLGVFVWLAATQSSAQWKPLKLSENRLYKSMRPKKIALVIGINQNKSGHWQALSYAKQDAQKMAFVLQRYANFDRILLRTESGQTTRASLVRSLRYLQKWVKSPMDTVFIYVSAHGTIAYDAHQKTRGRYIVTSDTTKNVPKTALSVHKIQSILKSFRSRNIALMLATCYTGPPQSKARNRRGVKGFMLPSHRLQSRAVQILSATGFAQPAFESTALRGDVYTHFFLRCVRQLRARKASVSAIEAHVCATRPTTLFVKRHRGEIQVPRVDSEPGSNRDVQLISNGTEHRKIGYFRTPPQKTKGLRYRILPTFKRKGDTENLASSGEFVGLKPGTYTVLIETSKGVLLSRRKVAVHVDSLALIREPWALTFQGGLLASPKTGGSGLGGGAIGMRNGWFGLQLAAWGNTTEYPQSGRHIELLLELRAEGGHQFNWEAFSLFAGGYLGVGWLTQHLTTAPQSGLLLQYGATLNPVFWVTQHWGLAAWLDAGFSLAQLGTELRNMFEWSARLGFCIRFF